jgi:hypothetical protein
MEATYCHGGGTQAPLAAPVPDNRIRLRGKSMLLAGRAVPEKQPATKPGKINFLRVSALFYTFSIRAVAPTFHFCTIRTLPVHVAGTTNRSFHL